MASFRLQVRRTPEVRVFDRPVSLVPGLRPVLVLFVLVLSPPLAVRAVEENPFGDVSAATVAARVDAFHTQLVEAMKVPGYRERVAVLEPVVAGFFDLSTVSRITLGRTWRELDEARRGQFRGLLERLIVATYADRFDRYDGQQFINVESVPARRGWVVKTELVRANGERVHLDYYFHGEGVFNVVADGVGDLSLRRADYNSIVKREGFASLLAHLEENIAKLNEADRGDAL